MAPRSRKKPTETAAPPAVAVPSPADAPVRQVNSEQMRLLGVKLTNLFGQYKSDRKIAEYRWLRNQRQYLGIYDPEIEKQLIGGRSMAYPKITRVKCISVLSRLMNLMFPGNERNWELRASPSPDLDVADVKQAIADAQKKDKDAGVEPDMGLEWVMAAIQQLADKRADALSKYIDDQLEELGGDQTYDYIALNRRVLQSGILYGLGVLRGPFARETSSTVWEVDHTGQPSVKKVKTYKPMFEFLPVWDFYPDMGAKIFQSMDGYFTRVVMSRSQLLELCKREDFFKTVIRSYLSHEGQVGNYKAMEHETLLREMGVRVNVNEQKPETQKYEIIVWHGPISGAFLASAGVEVDEDKLADEIDAEVWTVGGHIIKCEMNPWVALGVKVKTVHPFIFDEDDTSPIGQGLPNVVRDSQMSIAAATRMLLDNASVICGPNLELNMDLLLPNQDVSSTSAYKMWYREGTDQSAQFPAVKNIQIDGHLPELLQVIELFMKFADQETFVGPATGGDMEKAPSEPMRTAAGASMLRSDAALPFKDIVRAFDSLTQSIIESLVQFNKKFNPTRAPEGDYNVIARGATSLIAKEVRGMQIDQLATTLTPGEALHVDERKMVVARLRVRDLDDLLVSEEEAIRRKAQQDAGLAAQQKQAQDLAEANVRKLLSDAFKNIAQGQKNSVAADSDVVNTALALLEAGVNNALGQSGSGGPGGAPVPEPGDTGNPGGAEPASVPSAGDTGTAGGMPAPGVS